MNKAAAVRFVESAGYGCANVNGQFGSKPFLGVEKLAQTFAINKLHDHGLTAGMFHDIVDGNDVGVIQLRYSDCFAPETLCKYRVGGESWTQPFDGDASIQLNVGGHPHLGHSSLANPPFEAVAVCEQDRRIMGRCQVARR
jgi:hypothetical protein